MVQLDIGAVTPLGEASAVTAGAALAVQAKALAEATTAAELRGNSARMHALKCAPQCPYCNGPETD